MAESYDLDDDYIVIKNGYSPPSKTFGLLLTLIPGFLLFMNLRIFFARPSKVATVSDEINRDDDISGRSTFFYYSF